MARQSSGISNTPHASRSTRSHETPGCAGAGAQHQPCGTLDVRSDLCPCNFLPPQKLILGDRASLEGSAKANTLGIPEKRQNGM